jgi:arylformamidase
MPDHAVPLDISVALGPETAPFPGDTPFHCGWAWDMAQGASVNVGRVTTSLHVGTHADAPLHVRPGAPASETLPLAHFRGPARVVDVSRFTPGHEISLDELAPLLGDDVPVRLLLRTGHCTAHGAFPDGWPALHADTARWLVSQGLRLLGTDCPSADLRPARHLVVHHALFDGGASNLENLRLDHVPPGDHELVAYPVLVTGADAAPVRALLFPLP